MLCFLLLCLNAPNDGPFLEQTGVLVVYPTDLWEMTPVHCRTDSEEPDGLTERYPHQIKVPPIKPGFSLLF